MSAYILQDMKVNKFLCKKTCKNKQGGKNVQCISVLFLFFSMSYVAAFLTFPLRVWEEFSPEMVEFGWNGQVSLKPL